MTPAQKTIQSYKSQIKISSGEPRHNVDRFDQQKSDANKANSKSSFAELLKQQTQKSNSH